MASKSALALALLLSPTCALAEQAVAVEIVEVTRSEIIQDYDLTGTIQPVDSYAAGFRDGGRVTEVNVDVGDRVNRGDVIARVDQVRPQAAATAAQAALDAVEAALTQARQARDRAEALLERGSGTQSDLDAATEAFLTAQSARDQAQAQLQEATRALEDTVLTAVENAIVTERSAEPGQVVGPGQSVVTLASRDWREAVFLLPDVKDLDLIRTATVRLRPLDGTQMIDVPITELSPVTTSAGTVIAKAAIEDSDALGLAIGEPVVGELSIDMGDEMQVPWTALTATAEGPAVWLVDPDSSTVSLAQIVIAGFSLDAVEVSEGLEPGDLVVGLGSQDMFPGRKVIATTEDLQ